MLDQLFPTPPFNTPVMAYDRLLQLGLSMAVRAQQHTIFDHLLDFYITRTFSVNKCLPAAGHVTWLALRLNDMCTLDKIIARLDVAFVCGHLIAKKDLDKLIKFHHLLDDKQKNDGVLYDRQRCNNVQMSYAVQHNWIEGVKHLVAANAYNPDLVLQYSMVHNNIECFEYILPHTSAKGCTENFVISMGFGMWYAASALWKRMDIQQLDDVCQEHASSFTLFPALDMAVRKICREWRFSTAIPDSLGDLSRLEPLDHRIRLSDDLFFNFAHTYPEFRFAALLGAVVSRNSDMVAMWSKKITDNDFLNSLIENLHQKPQPNLHDQEQHIAEVLQKRFNQLEHEAISKQIHIIPDRERNKKM